ncbi:hypothetical protein [Streptomyces sp. V3I7]|uniref:hypothetical protein n=1 Tax=Streptomyces sp. V3I7 TaxID=3042278 RepID=UPI0035948991
MPGAGREYVVLAAAGERGVLDEQCHHHGRHRVQPSPGLGRSIVVRLARQVFGTECFEEAAESVAPALVLLVPDSGGQELDVQVGHEQPDRNRCCG